LWALDDWFSKVLWRNWRFIGCIKRRKWARRFRKNVKRKGWVHMSTEVGRGTGRGVEDVMGKEAMGIIEDDTDHEAWVEIRRKGMGRGMHRRKGVTHTAKDLIGAVTIITNPTIRVASAHEVVPIVSAIVAAIIAAQSLKAHTIQIQSYWCPAALGRLVHCLPRQNIQTSTDANLVQGLVREIDNLLVLAYLVARNH
jgi:hypothetical protein